MAASIAHVRTGGRRVALLLVRRFGLAGVAALGLLATAAVVYGVVTPRVEQRVALADARLRAAARRPAPAEATAATRSDLFAALPTIDSNASDLLSLYAIATARGIPATKAEYRLTPLAGGRYLAYEVRLPVASGYMDLRRFTSEALARLPNMAIDGMRFSRPDAGRDVLDAEIRVVLFYRS
ncbi:hypothetical protein ACPWT1_14935 [Ramlibacter sp. MMS24-I3-19]|uniref:hypothetical protein n=1 Tax=Ramlibacter sp. MMS24-I3-19 TaxID=3416606 RepID=UPI003CFF1DFF